MKVTIAGRSYKTDVLSIIRKPILAKAFQKFMKRKMSDELLDYVFCTAVQKKSPEYMYKTFIHNDSPTQINLGAHGKRLAPEFEEVMADPKNFDKKALQKLLNEAYDHVIKMIDSNFELEFSRSPELEEFALSQIRLTPREAAKIMNITDNRYMPRVTKIVLDLAMGRKKPAEGGILILLTKSTGKKQTRKGLMACWKALQKAM